MLCGSKKHNVLDCEHLTEKNVKTLEEKHEYDHGWTWWKDPKNILNARKAIFDDVKPQHSQVAGNASSPKHAHGIANIGPLERPAYFDLGGEYDLMDDMGYDDLVSGIKDGTISNAKIISPVELGHTSRGVPVDLACSTDGGSSIVWINRWIRITITVSTTSGRKFVLNQATIGFVKRSSPLLILGKSTCSICGYRTIRQQDRDRRDEHDREEESRRKKSLKRMAGAAAVLMGSKSSGHECESCEESDSSTAAEDAIEVRMVHEDGKVMLAGQFLQIAASDIPLDFVSEGEREGNQKEKEGKNGRKESKQYLWTSSQLSWVDESSCKHQEADARVKGTRGQTSVDEQHARE